MSKLLECILGDYKISNRLKNEECPYCCGSGWEIQFVEPCKKCKGTGFYEGSILLLK